jgi:hypothetical protein
MGSMDGTEERAKTPFHIPDAGPDVHRPQGTPAHMCVQGLPHRCPRVPTPDETMLGTQLWQAGAFTILGYPTCKSIGAQILIPTIEPRYMEIDAKGKALR